MLVRVCYSSVVTSPIDPTNYEASNTLREGRSTQIDATFSITKILVNHNSRSRIHLVIVLTLGRKRSKTAQHFKQFIHTIVFTMKVAGISSRRAVAWTRTFRTAFLVTVCHENLDEMSFHHPADVTLEVLRFQNRPHSLPLNIWTFL